VPLTRLPVHRLQIVAADGLHTSNRTAYCPSRRQAVDLGVCKSCAHAQVVTEDAVICAPPGPSGNPSTTESAAGASGLRTVVGVRANVPWFSAAPLAKAPPWQVPIVDGVDRFIGFVSSRDIASRRWPSRLLRLVPAGELAFGRFLAAPASMPLDGALRLMAHHGARALALVDKNGLLQGVLSDIDALRGLKR
jgi:hypothetical protein